MSDCAQCARAIIGVSSEPRWGCGSCSARAIARSSFMLDSMNKALPMSQREEAGKELAEAIRRAFPHMGYPEARHMVIEWWKCDRANEQEGKAYA